MKTAIRSSLLALLFMSAVAVDVALAEGSYILATGRRDPRIYAIDFNAALRPQNNNTSHAIVSRSKVLPDRLDGTPVGDPANILLSEDKRTAYVVNHHGAVDNAEFGATPAGFAATIETFVVALYTRIHREKAWPRAVRSTGRPA